MIEDIQPILNLIMSLLEHFGLISAAAFILLSSKALQRMISGDITFQDKLAMILFFGAFGIFGTYDGDPIRGVVANLRAISIITAGLIGGPAVGCGAGLIAGGHRFLADISGFSSFPCGLATFLEGAAAGIVSHRLRGRALNWRVAALLGLLGESAHMGLVLAISRPFDTAWGVVSLIGIPMILLNTIGVSCLVEMIHMVVRNRERLASIQARKAMTIANLTVSHLREGLNQTTARATARIIHEQTLLTGVAITDDRRLLAYAGIRKELLPVGGGVITEITQQVLNTGEPVFKLGGTVLGRDVPHPVFTSVIVVPLKKSGHTIGTLKFYGDKKHQLSNIDFEIASGLAELFSTQLELEDIRIKAQLVARAEIKRLQAQINPHFLFNSLNTIAAFCRTNSQLARQLLLELSNYLRRNIEDKREFITLDEELKQIKSYLAIEHARFGERIRFEMRIEPGVGQWPLPPLIIQPLVENAVKHGLSGKEEGGNIRIDATRDNGNLRIEIEDDGAGMPQTSIEQVFQKDNDHTGSQGMGLRNVNQRLEHIHGPAHRLKIKSRPDHGTTVTVNLPPLREQVFATTKPDG